MNCKLDTNLIQSLLEDTLSPLEKIFVEEHIKVCETCQNEFLEMKLLFEELDGLKFDDLDIPPEVAAIQNWVINKHMSASGSGNFGFKEFINIQKQVLDKAGIFMNFMPGVKPSASYIEKSIKKTPSLFYKALGGALTGGRKLMLMRARA